MSHNTTPLRRRLVGGIALAATTLGVPAAAHADDLLPGGPPHCWKEYDFTRSGDVLTATAFKDCTADDLSGPLPVAIQMWYRDEYWAGWITVASGTGVARTYSGYCAAIWTDTFRHSITHQQISC